MQSVLSPEPDVITETVMQIICRTWTGLSFEISYPIFQTNKPFKYNQYATKKTLAQGLLDIGLLMANASQLKALIDLGPNTQDYFWANVVNILGILFYLYLVNFKMPSRYFDKKK